jgi:hypothetical protein
VFDDGTIREANLYGQLEHSLDCWERRRVLPVPRWSSVVFSPGRRSSGIDSNGEVGI